MSAKPITNISTVQDVALFTIDNLPVNMKMISNIFSAIAKQNINVDMISQAPPFRGKINLSFSIPSRDIPNALTALSRFKKDVPDLNIEVESDNTKLTIFGEGMKDLPGVAAKLFTLLAANGIVIKLVTTSEVEISYLLNSSEVDKAKKAVKKEFGLL